MKRRSQTAARLRRLHVYAGLQACAGLVIYGLTTLVATQRDPAGEVRPPEVRHHQLSSGFGEDLEPTARAKKLVAALALGAVSGPWLAKDSPQGFQFLLGGPQGERRIQYNKRNGRVTETLSPTATGDLLVYLHQVRPPVRGVIHPGLVMWGVFNLVSVGSLAFLCLSGLALFLAGRQQPRYAWVALAVGVLSTVIALWWA